MQYRIGSVSVANGSLVVTGSGTDWTQLPTDAIFALPDQPGLFRVAYVDSATQLRLATPWTNDSVTEAKYWITADFTPFHAFPMPQKNDIESTRVLQEALLMIDQQLSPAPVGQFSVVDKDLNTPPPEPPEGAAYIVGPAPTGAWANHAQSITIFRRGLWTFFAPSDAAFVRVNDENSFYFYRASTGLWEVNALGQSGVASFNGRVGPVSLTEADVEEALGFLPSETAETPTLTIANVTGLQAALDSANGSPTWASVQNKPTLFATDWSMVQNRPAGNVVDWYNVTSKPTSFNPAAHYHAIGEVIGLQTALDSKQPAGTYLTAVNLTWDAVIDKPAAFPPTAHSHDASDITSGVIDLARLPVLPSSIQVVSSGDLGALTTEQQASVVLGAVVTTTDGTRYVYSGTGSKTQSASYVILADITPEWSVIANKPTTFPPSAHYHQISDVIALQGALDSKQPTGAYLTAVNLTWASITGKPTEFTPAPHDHSVAQISGLQTALDSKQPAGDYLAAAQFTWSDLPGKPTIFAPSTHEHSIAQISGLQTALDSKQPAGDYGSSVSYDLASRGVDTTGSAGSQKAPIEALRDLALGEFTENVGRALTGIGSVKVDGEIDLRNANASLGQVRFQATPTYSGVMLNLGRAAAGPNSRLSLPHKQELFAWGGLGAINSDVTLFHIDSDTSAGGEYSLKGAYAGTGLHITGNVEKKRIKVNLAYVDLALKIEQSAAGSADTIEIDLVAVNFTRLSELSYSSTGADTSIVFSGLAEGHVAKAADADVFTDENGKASTYNMVCRIYNGQGTGSYYRFNQTQNDYTDTIIWGGLSRHIHFYGRALNAQSVRRMAGTFRLRESANGRAWNGTMAEGAEVPTEAVFIGRVVDGGDFHLDLTGITNSTAVLYGNDTYYSIGCDFGRSHVSMGAFKPFNGEYPLTSTALTFYRAVNCTFQYSQVHGKIVIAAGIQNCTIRLPVTWARIGYGATIDPTSNFTIIVEGSLEYAEARSLPWLSQITGDQVVLFESITDKGGVSVTYKGGIWTLGSSHRASKLALSAVQSDINRDFRVPGLMVGVSADPTGTDVGKVFAATATGAWRESSASSTITPGEMVATGAFISRLGAAPSAPWRAIYDRFLYELSDIDALPATVAAYLFGMETEAASLKSVVPAVAGSVWYDCSKAGSPTWDAGDGFAMNPDTLDKITTNYDMSTLSHGCSQDDFLMLIGAERDNPAYSGSDNGFDLGSVNGKAKLRDRDNAEQLSVGTTTTTAFPSGTSRMPDVVMGGRVSSARQFGVDKGRLAVQSAVSTAGANGGAPDTISVGGSRIASCAGLFKASHFFEVGTGGVIKPIGDRPRVLYRAFSQYMSSVRALRGL